MRLPKRKGSFHAQHSPVGAHSSFTIGMHGAVGGFALEKGEAGTGAVYAGFIDSEAVTLFPFFKPAEKSAAELFDHQKAQATNRKTVHALEEGEITREYGFASDAFTSGELKFEVLSPFYEIPDPETTTSSINKRACCPTLFARLTLDNTGGETSKTAIFALHDHGCPMHLGAASEFNGFLFQDGELGMATSGPVEAFQVLDLSEIGKPGFKPRIHGVGMCFGFLAEVPAGESREILISLAAFRAGRATHGMEMAYWYTRYFANIRDVLEYSLTHSDWYLEQVAARDAELAASDLNEAQQFLVAHASHSYYGSTQWLDHGGQPFWNVNEGQYRMMNTFDLTVDMLFYEMRYSPWTVKNVLESFVTHYAYHDEVRLPGDRDKHPGGLSFTHDMGNRNIFSPKAYSSYELSDLDRECFSYMTHEQLVNWICCAGVYISGADDADFFQRHLRILEDCYQSLLNRDHPDPERRNGVMGCDSTRCGEGGEITTYDSLDHSLGQARNNLYLAVKSWAAYVILGELFARGGLGDKAGEARESARLCASTIVGAWDASLGYIPAVLEAGNTSAIIPAIEGLVFPKVMGLQDLIAFDGPYRDLMHTLKRHFQAVFQKGVCLYEDNGWKLSSTADNSWMSKIALCQYVARSVLGIDFGDAQLEQDTAHMDWEVFGSTFHACSDQFSSGQAMGSLYYPRIVTNILWLDL